MALPRNPNAFANSPLDRAGHLRRDADWLAAVLAGSESRCLVLHHGRPLLRETEGELTIAWRAWAPEMSLAPQPLFLGLMPDRAPHFACEAADPDAFAEHGVFTDLRAAGARLSLDELAIIGCAESVFDWHDRNSFCAKCGAPSRIVEAGWKRLCDGCKSEHFPRVDPVVIMLPEHDGKCLLGRQSAWPPGMMSALAGYMEPGETIEEAVARETFEEAGLVVTGVRVHSTQPWPFPSSLMIGVLCAAESDALTIDTEEIESARWFTKDEARQLLAGKHADCFCPPGFAIAHQLLKSWAEE
jgi:NAD+ diphosphatase